MKLEYIKKNLSLLDLIKLDLTNFKELYSHFQYTDNLNVCIKKFQQDNKDLNFDLLDLKDVYFLLNKYSTVIKNTSLERNIEVSNLFKNNPLLFIKYLQTFSKAKIFLYYKENKLFDLLLKLRNDDFQFNDFIYKMSEQMIFDFLKYLIEQKHTLIFPTNEIQKRESINFLKSLSVLPDFMEPYILNESALILKLKKEHSFEFILEEHFKKPWTLKKIWDEYNYQEEFRSLFLNKLKKEHLTNNLFHVIPEEVSYKLMNEMSFDEIMNLNLSKNVLETYFLKNIDKSLILISKMKKEFLTKYYKEIRKSILSGSKIGKQGLKFFLIKNRNKLDKELLEFSLKRYPRFYNSLKIKIDIDFNTTPFKKDLTLKDCIYKNTLSQEELNFVRKNIETLLKIKFEKRFNAEVKQIIKDYLQ